MPDSFGEIIEKPRVKRVLTQESFDKLMGRYRPERTRSQPCSTIAEGSCRSGRFGDAADDRNSFKTHVKPTFVEGFFTGKSKNATDRIDPIKDACWKDKILAFDLQSMLGYLRDLEQQAKEESIEMSSRLEDWASKAALMSVHFEGMVESFTERNKEMDDLALQLDSIKRDIQAMRNQKARTEGHLITQTSREKELVTHLDDLKEKDHLETLGCEELQVKITFLRQKLDKMMQQKNREESEIERSKRRLSEARANIVKEVEAEKHRSKSQLNKNQSRTKHLINPTTPPRTRGRPSKSATGTQAKRNNARINNSK